jgi:hypothetical protein
MSDQEIPTVQRSERGQILVVFVGGLVLLLAILALVIDLGIAFNMRRQEQNAADPGAVAAARYIPAAIAGVSGSVPSMWTAACFYASQNGFTPTRSDDGSSCVTGQPVDGSVLTVHYPPSPQATGYAGDRAYVEVVLTRSHKTFFANVVGLPLITVSTSAVAANDPGTAGTSSLVALSDEGPTDCSTAKLHGGGSGGGLYIFPATGVDPASGGYVQVNSSCGAANGTNDSCTDGSQGGLTIAGGTTIQSNTMYVQGGCNVNGGSANILPPTSFDERAVFVGDPLSLVRPPFHTDLPIRQCPTGPVSTATSPKTCNVNGTQTLQPGTYYGGWNIGNGTTLTLEPGIYIIAGGGIKQNGGLLAASGRVLIYSSDSPVCGTGSAATNCHGKLDFGGSAELNLRGLDKATGCPPYGATGCPYGGLLFWQDAHASGAFTDKANIELDGSSSLYLEGTIYAASGDVKITGNGLSTGCTPDVNGDTNCAAVQVISYTWDIGGAGQLQMPYDPSKFYDLRNKGLVR